MFLVEDIQLRVRDWPPNGYRPAARVRSLHLVDAAADDRFRWTVLIEQTRRGSVVTPQPKGFGEEVFAPDHERARHARCLVGA